MYGLSFEALEAALIEELAPQGVLQRILVGRIARAAWRLERAERLEVEVLEFRSYEGAGAGLALIRDGNGTRSFETLLRYRGAAMAEFWRALRTLKALQAEQAAATGPAWEAHPKRPAGRLPPAHCRQPNQPESSAGRPLEYALPAAPAPGRALHEPSACWLPNEPEPERRPNEIEPAPAPHGTSGPAPRRLVPNEPERHRAGRARGSDGADQPPEAGNKQKV